MAYSNRDLRMMHMGRAQGMLDAAGLTRGLAKALEDGKVAADTPTAALLKAAAAIEHVTAERVAKERGRQEKV